MKHEKVLTPHKKSIISALKSISEARINYTSQEASKFFYDLILGGGVFLK